MAKAAMTQSSSFILGWESRICTSIMAIMTGAHNVTKLVIASLLFDAVKPAITAAAQKRHKPVSIPVRRYKNLLLQRLHTSQQTNAINSTNDMDKV